MNFTYYLPLHNYYSVVQNAIFKKHIQLFSVQANAQVEIMHLMDT